NTNTEYSVKIRVNYSCSRINESGYDPGSLVITVKGIGSINRFGKIEAVVGADKASVSSKSRDWSYTWNKTKDIYTFTNNKEIKPNSTVSGYFDMLWQIDARSSIHGYNQDNIQAEILMYDGTKLKSNTLSISNSTKCDTHMVDIVTNSMYSYEGLAGGLGNPDDYFYVKYILSGYINQLSRGNDAYRYEFNLDSNNYGTGAVVLYTNGALDNIQTNKYTVNITTYSNNIQVVVAYPKSEYTDKNVKADLAIYGTYYEGDDSGNTDEKQLAFDSIETFIASDFSFSDIPGDIYEYWKDTYYDKNVDSSIIQQRGGDIQGSKLISGTTETFYLEGIFNKPNSTKVDTEIITDVDSSINTLSSNNLDIEDLSNIDGVNDTSNDTKDITKPISEINDVDVVNTGEKRTYKLEMVDDFIYILQTDGEYRQLEAGEYEIKYIELPGTKSLTNINNKPLTSGIYPVEVYAFQNGELVELANKEPLYKGVMSSSERKVELPENTTAVAIIIDELAESIRKFSIPIDIEFHLNENGNDNLVDGQLVNTSFIKVYENDTLINNTFTEDNYQDDTNLGLAQKDKEIYGMYLDREEDNISFYVGEKSDYSSYTDITAIRLEDGKYYSQVTLGADFKYKESETPSKFSLYTILPEKVSLNGYDIEEDLWNVIKLSGLDLNELTLINYCSVDIDEDYKNSGRTYIALHFDFTDMEIKQDSSIRAKVSVKIDKSYFKKIGTSVLVRSTVLIDADDNLYQANKYTDDGAWNSSENLIWSDINNNGNTNEYIDYSLDHTTYTYVDSGQLQLVKYVKTSSIKEFVQLPDLPKAEQNSKYTYKLAIENGNGISKNIIVTDMIENSTGSQWQGTFKDIDLSEADDMGLKYTVWYSANENPGDLGNSNWSTSLEPSQVRSIAIDFGDSELKEGDILNIYINMIAPSEESLKGLITENKFQASFTMIETTNNNEAVDYTLESNPVQVKLTAKLKNI
ncbi:MAG: hypothetical protein J6A59_11505, partial [Lachnospiraceae bacterium]|nr:hypothetical protein [Lachnospiraceae bacterium]